MLLGIFRHIWTSFFHPKLAARGQKGQAFQDAKLSCSPIKVAVLFTKYNPKGPKTILGGLSKDHFCCGFSDDMHSLETRKLPWKNSNHPLLELLVPRMPKRGWFEKRGGGGGFLKPPSFLHFYPKMPKQV